MKSKTKIKAYPDEGKEDYSHLQPIVDFLIKNGNIPATPYIWGNNRTGYFCHLKNDIDFHGIKENFELPDSIKLNEEKQTIDCFNTYSIIRKL